MTQRTCTDTQPCAIHNPVHVCGGEETPESLADVGLPVSEQLRPAVAGWVSAKAWWPRRKHPKNWRVIVDCCNRRVHLHTTEAHLSIAYSGYVSDWRFRCASGQGCTVNPNYKRTAHLREWVWA